MRRGGRGRGSLKAIALWIRCVVDEVEEQAKLFFATYYEFSLSNGQKGVHINYY